MYFMKSKLYLTLTLSFLIVHLFAQPIKEFSANKMELLTQLDGYTNASKRKDLEATFNTFKGVVSAYNEAQFKEVHANLNTMLKQKMSANPFFLDYMKALNGIARDERGGGKLDQLNQVLAQVMAAQKKPYSKKVLEFAALLYEQNALKASKTTSWLVESPKMALKYADNIVTATFPNASLKAVSRADSIEVVQTSGVFYPLTQKWEGEKGQISWLELGMSDAVYAKLEKYSVDLKKNELDCPVAYLNHPDFFGTQSIKGDLKDKLMSSRKSADNFPKFSSVDQNLSIPALGPGIKFKGGFQLNGKTVTGYSKDKNNKARIEIYDDKEKLALKAQSKSFNFKLGSRMIAEGVEVELPLSQGSITHPSADLRYDFSNKRIQLSRGKKGSNRNPFYSTFHNVMIGTEKLTWDLGQDSIFFNKNTLSMGGVKKDNIYESNEFFSEGAYRKIQNIATKNPIAILNIIYNEYQTKTIDAIEFATKMNPRFNVKSAQSLIYELVEKGFIKFDPETEMMEIQDKALHYADAARKKVDYDGVSIRSYTDRTSAVMNLKQNNAIVIDEVKVMEFSSKNKVAIQPINKQVVLKKDRDIDFDGRVFAGISNYEGKDFHFLYQPYQIKMDSIRYMDIFKFEGRRDEKENPVAYSINSRIEHIQGVVDIDAPGNKSGVKETPEMPAFRSTGPGYIYYDTEESLKGIYKRDSFYFELDKFTLAPLGDYRTYDLNFDGTMHSSEIFPPFKEKVTLQEEDQSLGFVAKTPGDGFTAYRNKGKFKGTLTLNNKGFYGNGNVRYLNASVNSESIRLRPKELVCDANVFSLEEQRTTPEIPQVRGQDISIQWKPYQDSMYIKPKAGQFDLYTEGIHTMKGNLILTPGGVFGSGTFDWGKAAMTADLLLFGAKSVMADTCNLRIRAADAAGKLAFDTKNVNGKIDFDKNIGNFKSNSTEITTTMPYNQYKTSMDEFAWDMNKGTIAFKSKPGASASFLSIHPEQDSLIFEGKTAEYDYKNSTLKVDGVEFVQSADALIYPGDGKVAIEANAVMTTLENAKIVASKENKNHVINRATVNIKGKKDYTASGFYEYNLANRKQEFELQNITGSRIGKGARSEKTTATRASGEIAEDDNFYIDHKLKYRGSITLSSDSKDLMFDGFAQLDAALLSYRPWWSLKSKGDKKDLAVRFDEPKSIDGQPVRAGLYLSRETAQLYPSIMAPLYFRKDRDILDTRGILKYNEKKEEFIMGDSTKILAKGIRGNLLSFNAKTGKIYAEGDFTLGQGLKYMQIKAAGRAFTKMIPAQKDTLNGFDTPIINTGVDVDFMVGIDFPFPEKVLQIMVNDIANSSFDYKDVELANNDLNQKAAASFITKEKDYELAMKSLASKKTFELPKRDQHTIFLNKLPMFWDTDYQSFISKKGMIGIGSINGIKINGLLEAYVEFKMPSNLSDGFYLYIQLPQNGNFYYFAYKNNVMSAVSSNGRFTDAVVNMKKKERIIKMDNGGFYEITPVNPGSAKFFANRVKEAWKTKSK